MKQPIEEECILDVLGFLDENWGAFVEFMKERGSEIQAEAVYDELDDAVKDL